MVDADVQGGNDDLIGQSLGNYAVLDRVGAGGMGTVYTVEHRNLKKRFAAKVLSKEHSASDEARARFSAEAHAASQLDHENVVSVSDYGVSNDGRPYLIMELLRGETLDQRLAKERLTLSEVVAIFVPTCYGLMAAHAAGLVHRDVKPENIFLVQRSADVYTVKVLDFGIAKAMQTDGRVTKMGQALGSPSYMAPEACRGDSVDARADIYSLGVVLFQLLCMRLPFEHTNPLQLLHAHSTQPVPKPRSIVPELDEALEAVILKALEKNPQQRFQTIEEMLTTFEAVLPPGADELSHRWQAASHVIRKTPVPRRRVSLDGGALDGRTSANYPATAGEAATTMRHVAHPQTPPGKSKKWLALFAAVPILVAVGGVVLWPVDNPPAPPATGQSVPRPAVVPPAPMTGPALTPPAPMAGPAVTPPAPTTGPAVTPPAPEFAVLITTTPAGATVMVDGAAIGTTPISIKRPQGTRVEMQLDKPGYAPQTTAFTVTESRTLAIELLAKPKKRESDKKTPAITTPQLRGSR